MTLLLLNVIVTSITHTRTLAREQVLSRRKQIEETKLRQYLESTASSLGVDMGSDTMMRKTCHGPSVATANDTHVFKRTSAPAGVMDETQKLSAELGAMRPISEVQP